MQPDSALLQFRLAGPDDADAIADLHIRSWRANYRGSMSDAYLDGPIEGERQMFWRQRLQHPVPGLWTLLAERDGAIVGFLCALVDHDAQWGTFIDNLHADPGAKRQGIGRAMLQQLGLHLAEVRSHQPVYLFVLQANTAAIAFYHAMGGATAEAMVKTEPDGSPLAVYRIAWPSVAAFLAQGREP